MNATGVDTITLSRDEPLWADHFPGDPILPGIAQIRLGLDAARRRLGHAGPVRGLSRIKFSRILRPGDVLAVAAAPVGSEVLAISAAPVEGDAAEREPEPVTFSIDCEGETAARGRLHFGRPDAAPAGATPPLDALPSLEIAPPLEAVLAHRRSMCWLDAVRAHGEAGTRCAIDVGRSAAFVGAADRAPTWLALEWMAQAVSAHDNLVRRARLGPDTPPRIGFLLGTRRLDLFCESLDATAPATVEVRHLWGGDGLTASFDATVRDADARPVARARLSCGVPPESASIAP